MQAFTTIKFNIYWGGCKDFKDTTGRQKNLDQIYYCAEWKF